MVGARATGLTSLSRALIGGLGGILMLHRVSKSINPAGINDFLCIDPVFLDRLIDTLKREGFRFVSMDEAVDRIARSHRDERFLALTLDDGYRDNLTAAAPIFRAHETPYTIFVTPGFVEGTAHVWWDVLAAVIAKQDRIAFDSPQGRTAIDCATRRDKHAVYNTLIDYLTNDLVEETQRRFVCDLADAYSVDCVGFTKDAIMDWEELRSLRDDPLCTIGAHTINHFHLARLPEHEAMFEMEQSAKVLQIELGSRPAFFAYPYGGPNAAGKREVVLARACGFKAAVTTRHGLIRSSHAEHLHALPRISVNGNYQRAHYVRTLLSGVTVPVSNLGRLTVTI
ncbi:MAG: polysaccharide deacetylase family protein [Pseudomonadota bacterium]